MRLLVIPAARRRVCNAIVVHETRVQGPHSGGIHGELRPRSRRSELVSRAVPQIAQLLLAKLGEAEVAEDVSAQNHDAGVDERDEVLPSCMMWFQMLVPIR